MILSQEDFDPCMYCKRPVITTDDGWMYFGYDFARNRIICHTECQEMSQ
jgi:hypothetical protein